MLFHVANKTFRMLPDWKAFSLLLFQPIRLIDMLLSDFLIDHEYKLLYLSNRHRISE